MAPKLKKTHTRARKRVTAVLSKNVIEITSLVMDSEMVLRKTAKRETKNSLSMRISFIQ